MLKLKTIGTGSSGNCYSLTDSNGKILLLDLGLNVREIQRGIGYRISDVVAAVVTHNHKDHSKSVKDFEEMGIPVFKPYEDTEERKSVQYGDFKIISFPLTNADGRYMHTNADGSECACYGFLITHKELGKMLYITDTELVKWRFKGINHILISCNYQKKYLSDDDGKRNHVLRGHMELETVKEFVKANKSDNLQTVILCHMSHDNAEPLEMVEEVQKVAGKGVYVDYARAGVEVELRKGDEPPF